MPPLPAFQLTDQEVREAVAKHVAGKVFYSSSAVGQMSYAAIESAVVYVYNLQSFTEARETAWVSVPHTPSAVMVDGPHNGPIPAPWDVIVQPSAEFVTGKTKVPVPHSEHVVPCQTCLSAGSTRCSHCAGMGSKGCTWCSGSGVRRQFDESRMCTSCNGSGRDRCTWCSGQGYSRCSTCNGSGQVKQFIQLTIRWDLLSSHVISSTANNGTANGLAEKRVIEAPKQLVFEETAAIVAPITPAEFPDQDIVNASAELVQQHLASDPTKRVIRMRQTISGIPVTKVHYQRKNKRDVFFVYGDDRKVHFDSYPSKNCCIA